MTQNRHYQSGNVLFLILIAVVLFAALSYAITQSSRGSHSGVSNEKLQLQASKILQYSTALENAIMRMQVYNGCTDAQISFEHSPFNGSDTTYDNPTSPSDFSCHVFHPNGGSMSVFDPVSDEFLQSTGWVVSMSTTAWYNDHKGQTVFVGQQIYKETPADLYLVIPFLTEELCNVIHSKITGSSVSLPEASQLGYMGVKYKGSYLGTAQNPLVTSANGCGHKSNDDFYIYYHVLIPH